jgi:hypothetical protein
VQQGVDFVKGAAKAYGGVPLLEPTHGTIPWLDVAVILFQVVVYVIAGPVYDSILKNVPTRTSTAYIRCRLGVRIAQMKIFRGAERRASEHRWQGASRSARNDVAASEPCRGGVTSGGHLSTVERLNSDSARRPI